MTRGELGVLLAAVLVMGLGGTCLAGAMYRNDSGAVARAIRIEFSEPAEITSMYPSFPQRDPQGPAAVIVLSGGEIAAGGWFSFTWRPDSARVVKIEWMERLGPTFEEIMAAIARYPGEDEPLYQPGPEEAIWLTDLEGHAEIYDNNSIRINYAPWFDQSQITRIEVYRNGVRMRFLPDRFDVLTNDQMKTFDGNPLEFSPASSHTDHAIMGYEFSLCFYGGDGSVLAEHDVRIASRVRFSGAYRFASVLGTWFNPMTRMYRDWNWVRQYLRGIREDGIEGVQVDVHLYMDSPYATEVFPIYDRNTTRAHPWLVTAPDEVIVRMIRTAREAGLAVELRIQLLLTDDCLASHPEANRGAWSPSNVELWRASFTKHFLHYANIAEEHGADYFCLMVENDMFFNRYPDVVRRMLADAGQVFSGELMISESTFLIRTGGLLRFNLFYDAPNTVIGMNCWAVPFETQADQRLSEIAAALVSFWRPAVEHYRREFSDSQIVFAEIGTYNYDGSLTVSGVPTISEAEAVRDD